MSRTKEKIISSILKARSELEEVLYELEKLPVSTGSSVRFAAHALNNFLSVTMGTVQLLQISLEDHPDPQIKKWLEGLLRTTGLMAETVDKLMDTPVNRELQLHFEKVNLLSMVHRFCHYYQNIADRKSIRLRFESEVEHPFVRADRVIVATVLDNLISNAVKYSMPGKEIKIRISSDGRWIICSVCDQGPGISEEEQSRLFQPGLKLTPRATGGEPSSGYGLAVAKEYIEKLGGSIWCESVLGKGSCFSFKLPAYEEEEESEKARQLS